MARSAIVWNGLKRVERVVGRQTVAAAALEGAGAGAVWFGIAQWQTGGRRDFAAVGTFETESYDARVPIDQRDHAERILGVTQSRSIDSPPAESGPVPPPPTA